jgi:hypothetical protein
VSGFWNASEPRGRAGEQTVRSIGQPYSVFVFAILQNSDHTHSPSPVPRAFIPSSSGFPFPLVIRYCRTPSHQPKS